MGSQIKRFGRRNITLISPFTTVIPNTYTASINKKLKSNEYYKAIINFER